MLITVLYHQLKEEIAMSSVNKVILIGNICQEVEVRTMKNGEKVCNLSIATNEHWKDRQTGERKEKSEFHRVIVFNKGLVSVCENYLKKGAKVYIEGQIETRKWQDQSGQDKYSTEIVLRPFKSELTMLDSRGSGNEYNQDDGQSGYNQAPAAGIQDDEIPF